MLVSASQVRCSPIMINVRDQIFAQIEAGAVIVFFVLLFRHGRCPEVRHGRPRMRWRSQGNRGSRVPGKYTGRYHCTLACMSAQAA